MICWRWAWRKGALCDWIVLWEEEGTVENRREYESVWGLTQVTDSGSHCCMRVVTCEASISFLSKQRKGVLYRRIPNISIRNHHHTTTCFLLMQLGFKLTCFHFPRTALEEDLICKVRGRRKRIRERKEEDPRWCDRRRRIVMMWCEVMWCDFFFCKHLLSFVSLAITYSACYHT